jgi:hypothetical protein
MSRRFAFVIRAALVTVLLLITLALVVASLRNPCPCCRG